MNTNYNFSTANQNRLKLVGFLNKVTSDYLHSISAYIYIYTHNYIYIYNYIYNIIYKLYIYIYIYIYILLMPNIKGTDWDINVI